MGLYTNTSRWSGVNAYPYSDEIAANESYDAAFGCARIMMDIQQNDMACFEAAIKDDVREVMAYNEGVSYVNENAFTDVLKKIVDMFKKLIAKIKGIIKSFIVKLTGAFRDSKKMVQKYQKQIVNYTNWTGFKVKNIRVPKQNDVITDIQSKLDIKGNKSCYNINFDRKNENLYGMSIEKINNGDYDKETIRLNIIKEGGYFSGVADKISSAENVDEIKEVVYDEIWEDKDDIDDDTVKSGSYFVSSWIKQTLENSDKTIKEIRKKEKKLNDWIDKIITELNKANDDLSKVILDKKDVETKNISVKGSTFSGGDRYDKSSVSHDINDADSTTRSRLFNAENVQKIIRAAQTIASNEQEVITMNMSIYMESVKFAIAEARKIWTAAAAWSSGVHKESYEYINALVECTEEEFYSNMENI